MSQRRAAAKILVCFGGGAGCEHWVPDGATMVLSLAVGFQVVVLVQLGMAIGETR